MSVMVSSLLEGRVVGDVGPVYLEINGRAFELDLEGRTSRQVLAETRRLVRLMQAGVGPQVAVLPLRPRDGGGTSEDVMINADVVRRAHVMVHVGHLSKAAS